MNYLKNRSSRFLLLTIVLDVVFFSTTNPAKVAPLWLIAGFLLLVVTLYWFFRGLTLVLGVYIKSMQKQRAQLTGVLTITTTILLGLQSMGQLSVRDFLVLLPLVLLGYFYLRYNRRREAGN